jgi:GMP synthase-like glutamine amidotransferase
MVVASRAASTQISAHAQADSSASVRRRRADTVATRFSQPEGSPIKLLVIQHCPLTPAGVVGETVAAHGAALTTIMPHHGDAFPTDPDSYDGLVVLGGPMHAGDDQAYPAFAHMLRLIRRFHGGGRPVLGVCLGAQLIARAFGKTVYPWREMELGYIPVRLTAEGRADRLLRGLAPRQRLLQLHEDSFDLPEGATLLMTGDCHNQALRVGETTYGFQFHMEVTWTDAHDWLRDCRPWIEKHLGADAERRCADVAREIARYHAEGAAFTAEVTRRWLSLVEERSLWRDGRLPLRAAG